MTPVHELKTEKNMDSHDLEELEKNIEARVKVNMVWEEVKSLSATLKAHMEQEEVERKKIDKKLLYLFLIATGNLAFTGGGDMMAFLFQLFL